MKTLSKSNGLKKLNALGHSKSLQAYKMVAELLGSDKKTYAVSGNVIRPCYTSGSGRFTSNQDHTNMVVLILKRLDIEFELTNDAPRGSATGNKITILTKIK